MKVDHDKTYLQFRSSETRGITINLSEISELTLVLNKYKELS